jgi:hypothetical protein
MWKSNLRQSAGAAVIGVAALCMAAPGAWASTSNEATSPTTWQTPHQISQAYAETRILGDNYTDVTNMKQTNNGWTANALESGKQVSLAVNNMGDVDKI